MMPHGPLWDEVNHTASNSTVRVVCCFDKLMYMHAISQISRGVAELQSVFVRALSKPCFGFYMPSVGQKGAQMFHAGR
jgi:hypothetical protein